MEINRFAAALAHRDSNCIGTSLFLAGLIPRDEVVLYPDSYLEKLVRLKDPVPGALVAFTSRELGYAMRMGIIAQHNPLLLVERTYKFGPVVHTPLSRVKSSYIQWCRTEYYQPQDLGGPP